MDQAVCRRGCAGSRLYITRSSCYCMAAMHVSESAEGAAAQRTGVVTILQCANHTVLRSSACHTIQKCVCCTSIDGRKQNSAVFACCRRLRAVTGGEAL